MVKYLYIYMYTCITLTLLLVAIYYEVSSSVIRLNCTDEVVAIIHLNLELCVHMGSRKKLAKYIA